MRIHCTATQATNTADNARQNQRATTADAADSSSAFDVNAMLQQLFCYIIQQQSASFTIALAFRRAVYTVDIKSATPACKVAVRPVAFFPGDSPILCGVCPGKFC